MKKNIKERKLSLNKIQIAILSNLQAIRGGEDAQGNKTQCMFPANMSKKPDGPIRA